MLDVEGDPETLARVWLDVNCSMCHLPDGIAPMKHDLRFDTPTDKMNLVNQPIGQRRRRPPDVKLVAPGRPELSELLTRISTRGPYQMPPLATHYVDPRGCEVVRRWTPPCRSRGNMPRQTTNFPMLGLRHVGNITQA